MMHSADLVFLATLMSVIAVSSASAFGDMRSRIHFLEKRVHLLETRTKN
jgi:hypothetical protein